MTKTQARTKTLVTAKHVGQGQNGFDGCHARIHHGGRCPGHETAAWLNSLGPDAAPFYTDTKGVVRTRCGDVRDNYLRFAGSHVVALEPHVARLAGERRELLRQLVLVRRRIQQATGGVR